MGFKKKAGKLILLLLILDVAVWVGFFAFAAIKTLGE